MLRRRTQPSTLATDPHRTAGGVEGGAEGGDEGLELPAAGAASEAWPGALLAESAGQLSR
jgi:hypothetical protein